jgi:hypothetical protein
MRKRIFAISLTAALLSGCLLVGCGSESAGGSSLKVGSKLYDQNGELWGTVVEVSDAHTFENGAVEPGVKVDYGPRMGNPPVPPQWLPSRSAEKFDVK